ncbi:unnamed protein product [Trichobilharzia regenti]|nr:unnamed protein product [Trichobilharzia regenti]
MPLPSEDSSSLPSGSNSLENSSDFCMTVGMPSSKSSTKVSTSNIRPPFNIANILSPQNETKTSSSRQSGDHIQITENNKYVQNTNPLLNYGKSSDLVSK